MIEWVVSPVEGWLSGYSSWVNLIIRTIEEALKARESEIEQWLKDNHPFQNRTGLAEASLTAKVFRDGLFVHILMYYGVDIHWSWWLEGHMWRGDPWRFSVLTIALDYWGPVLLQDVRKILE